MEKKATKRALLITNCILLTIGNCGGPLTMRLYFNHGGKRAWFSSWLQTAAWPIIVLPLFISYLHRRRQLRSNADSSSSNSSSFFLMKPPLFIASAIVGILTGLDDFCYAYGLKFLPVSTSSLIIASQLAFTAVFAFLMVKQKFTAYTVNAVVLLTVGSGILALQTSGDKPAKETQKQYVLGFIMTVIAAAVYGFILPLVEFVYKKAKQEITYNLVLEFQMVMSLSATVACTVIPREARGFGLGETMYYVVVVFVAITWQSFFVGAIGVIFCASSLASGILISVLLPFTEILAVIFFHEKFQAEKGVSLALSLWGFVSYFYGEIKKSTKASKPGSDIEMNQAPDPRDETQASLPGQ